MPTLRNNERLQQLQQLARERNAGVTPRHQAKKYIRLKRRTNDRSKAPAVPGGYRSILAGQGLIMPYLAISYRPDPVDGGLFVQGAWKQFKTATEANSWLSSRARAGAAVYTGTAIYTEFDQVLTAWEDPDTHHSVWLAVNHYLGWRAAGR